MRLAFDHHYPRSVVDGLRAKGHDVHAIAEFGWHDLDDAILLVKCAESQLVLVTNNVADFTALARLWQLEGRSHAGLVFTSDARWPRTKAASGALIEALHAFLRARGADACADLVHWL